MENVSHDLQNVLQILGIDCVSFIKFHKDLHIKINVIFHDLLFVPTTKVVSKKKMTMLVEARFLFEVNINYTCLYSQFMITCNSIASSVLPYFDIPSPHN